MIHSIIEKYVNKILGKCIKIEISKKIMPHVHNRIELAKISKELIQSIAKEIEKYIRFCEDKEKITATFNVYTFTQEELYELLYNFLIEINNVVKKEENNIK